MPAQTGNSFRFSSSCSVQTTFPSAITISPSSAPTGIRSATPSPDSKFIGDRMQIPPKLRLTPRQSNIRLVVIHFTARSNCFLGYCLVPAISLILPLSSSLIYLLNNLKSSLTLSSQLLNSASPKKISTAQIFTGQW